MAVKVIDTKGGPTVRWGDDVRNNRAISDAAMSSIRFVTDIEITTRFLLDGVVTEDALRCAELVSHTYTIRYNPPISPHFPRFTLIFESCTELD